MSINPLRSGMPVVGPNGLISAQFQRWVTELIAELESTVFPVGMVGSTFSATEPSGWKFLNGQALDQDDFAELYAVIGNTFGGTSTTFNLPDLTDKGLIGAGTISLKGTGGSNSLTLTVAQLPAHSHAVTDAGHTHGVTDAGHSHGVTDPGHDHTDETTGSEGVQSGAGATVADYDAAGATSSDTTGITVDSATTGLTVDSAATGISVDSTGSGDAIDTTPASIGVNWMIKT